MHRLEQRLPDWPIRSAGLFMGWSGECFMVCMSPRITDAETDLYYRQLDASLNARGDDRFGFVFASGEGQSTAKMQESVRRQGEFLKARAEILRRTTVGFAMITESFLTRIATRTIFTFAPPPYPYSIVASARAAFEYIAARGAQVDIAAAVRMLQTESRAIGVDVP